MRGAYRDRGASRKDREAIIVTEIPYQVNKARMIERIAEVVRDKRIEGISDLRDESDRHGVRVVVELKRDADARGGAEPALPLHAAADLASASTCWRSTAAGRRLMNLKQILEAFIAFREEVITRRTVYRARQGARARPVLVGLAIAVANIDEVIALIRAAKDPQVAREQLMAQAVAGRRRGAADRADRRAGPDRWWTATTRCRRPRPAPSWTCACSA